MSGARPQPRYRLYTSPSGYLRFESFQQVVEANPHLTHIELSNYGEMFLNPQLHDIVRYAHERGISLTADGGVNLNTIKDERLFEALVKYRFYSMA